MFTAGFEKNASFIESGTRLLGKGLRAASKPGELVRKGVKFMGKDIKQTGEDFKSLGRAIKSKSKATGKAFSEGFQPHKPLSRVNPVTNKAKPDRGATLLKKQTEKHEADRLKNPENRRPLVHANPKDQIAPESKRALTVTEKKRMGETAVDRVKQRRQRMKDKAKGPSFAMKHPIFTMGAGAIGMKAMSGDKREERPAYVNGPSY